MAYQSYRDLIRTAIAEAKTHPSASLPALAAAHHIELLQRGNNHYAKKCPWCGGKQKLRLRLTHSGWRFGCFKSDCEAARGGDAIDFLALVRGTDRRTAIRTLLEIAGIEHPWDRITSHPDARPVRNREHREGGAR